MRGDFLRKVQIDFVLAVNLRNVQCHCLHIEESNLGSPSPEAFREIGVPRKHGALTIRHGDLPTKTWNKTSRRFSCEAYAMSLHMPRDQVFGQ